MEHMMTLDKPREFMQTIHRIKTKNANLIN